MAIGSNIIDMAKKNPELAQLLDMEQPEQGPGQAEWEKPIPLYSHNPVPFPTDIFPDWLRKYVEAEAEATQTPTDLAGMLALSVLATAATKKFIILVQPGWVEPLNLWTVTTLPPGNRKSGVFADMVAPVEEYESRERDRLAPKIDEVKTQRKILEQSLQQAESRAAKAKPDERDVLMREAIGLSRELSAMKDITFPQLAADDCSPEAVATLLATQGGKIAILSPEGDIFDIMAGRYSSSANLGNFLKGHAGDTIRVTRVNRAPEHIKKPALTMGLTIQPDVLSGLVDTPGFRGRGLLGRFLYALPNSPVGHRKINPLPVPAHVVSDYSEKIIELLSLPMGINENGEALEHTLKLSVAASNTFYDFQCWLEPQLRPSGELGDMTDWAGKLAGAVARIAGLLHLAGHVDMKDPWVTPVEADTVDAAIKLAKEYLISHAKAAFAEMGADPDVESAKYTWRIIQDKGCEEFKKQDIWQWTKGRFKKVEPLDRALAVLVNHGYISEHTEQRKGAGRKPAPTYKVNPLSMSYNSYNTYNADDGGNSRDCRNTRMGYGDEKEGANDDVDSMPF